MLAASTADMNAEFIVERRQSAFERSNNARCNARGMPVHAHDGTERLKPEGICESSQQLVPTIVMDDGSDMTAPSRVIRSASHCGTWPPCNGKSALPARRVITLMCLLEFAGRQTGLFMLCTMAGDSGQHGK
jgi:hypothetical protein